MSSIESSKIFFLPLSHRHDLSSYSTCLRNSVFVHVRIRLLLLLPIVLLPRKKIITGAQHSVNLEKTHHLSLPLQFEIAERESERETIEN